MNTILIKQEQYDELISKIEAIQSSLENTKKKPEDQFLDNQEFIQLMNISKRLAQTWRDNGTVSFSQVGSKIYYRMSDVQKLLDVNYRKVLNPKRRKF